MLADIVIAATLLRKFSGLFATRTFKAVYQRRVRWFQTQVNQKEFVVGNVTMCKMELTAAGQEAIWRRFRATAKAARREVVKEYVRKSPRLAHQKAEHPYKIMDKRSAVALFHGRVKRLHQNAKTTTKPRPTFGKTDSKGWSLWYQD
jgi:hypothetical protein